MSDPADIATEMQAFYDAGLTRQASIAVEKMPMGVEGDCELCDTHSARLVKVKYRGGPALACAQCRDHFKLG